MQSEWIIGFLILLIMIQLFMLMDISTGKKSKKSKKESTPNQWNECNKCDTNRCFKESYTSLANVFRQIYDNNMDKYVKLYQQNPVHLDLDPTLTQIVSSGEKIGKNKEEIKKELKEKGININI